jgi:hypothetical protein
MSRLPMEEAQRLARANNRATVRYRCAPATSGKVFLADDQELRRAWVINISKTGIGIVLSRSLPVGAFITIQMRSSQGTLDMSAHVVHVTRQGPAEWFVGCELINPLNDDELDGLL